MKKFLLSFALLFLLVEQASSQTTINNLGAGRGSVIGADLFSSYQGANPAVRPSATQIAAYVYGLMSADATASGAGAITLATVNANVGTFGSATSCVTFTTNAKGLITAASQATCTPAIASITGMGTGVATALAVNVGTAGSFVVNGGVLGTPSSGTLTNTTGFPLANLSGAGTGVLSAAAAALNASTGLVGALTATNGNCVVGNGTAWTSTTCPGGTAANPTATAGPTAVNGVASTYMRSDGAPAVQQGSSSIKGIVQVDNTTITASSGVISAVNTGTVTSVGASCGNVAAPNPITASGTIDAGIAIRTVSGTTDTVLAADCGNLVNYTNAGAVAVTLPQAGTAGFATRAFFQFCSQGAGTTTITPTTSTIGGAATKTLTGGTAAAPICTGVISDGTNYQLVPSSGGGGSGTVTTTGSPASGNLARFSGATSITNDNLSGDCTTSGTLATTCIGVRDGYVSGQWATPNNPAGTSTGSAHPQNTIGCRPVVIPRLITINALGAVISTLGSTNVQLAIYANNTAANRPGTLIGNTGSIVNTSTGAVSGSLAANKQLGPGGADGGKFVWFCSNQNDSTAAFVTNLTTDTTFGILAGSSTLLDITTNTGSNDGPSGVNCSGAGCQGGSSTFGTWPANLTTSTWNITRPSTSGNFIPVIYMRAN